MWKTRPVWPARAAQAADWPRLATAWGSLRHGPAQRDASGDPAGRGLSHLIFHIGDNTTEYQRRVKLQVARTRQIFAN
eukprot:scaffold54795_cov57-Phaeocystis_antarctica.AAC.2